MGLFSRFENKAEDVIEGSAAAGGGIEPVKIAKRACKEMEREKMVGVGHEYAPTLYNVLLSAADDAHMSGYYPSLAGEMETYITSRAGAEGLVLDCPPLVRFIVDEGLKRGKFDVIAESVSPAIIDELRHEEMVHYGIEPADPYEYEDYGDYQAYEPASPAAPETPGGISYDEGYGYDYGYEPTEMPQAEAPGDDDLDGFGDPEDPFEDPLEAFDEPVVDPLGTFDEGMPGAQDPMQPEPQMPQNAYPAGEARTYPPTEAPATPANADVAAQKTVMVGAMQEPEPEAALIDHARRCTYEIRGARTILGRESSCDVVILDPSVSRRHAEVLYSDAGWLIRDTGSTNGISVNGTPTTQSRIYSGDIIDLGKTQLEFRGA